MTKTSFSYLRRNATSEVMTDDFRCIAMSKRSEEEWVQKEVEGVSLAALVQKRLKQFVIYNI